MLRNNRICRFAIALVLVSCTNVFATEIGISAKAGYGFGKFHGSKEESVPRVNSGVFSLGVPFSFNPVFTFEPEFAFSFYTFSDTASYDIGENLKDGYTYKSNSLEWCLGLKASLPFDKFQPFIKYTPSIFVDYKHQTEDSKGTLVSETRNSLWYFGIIQFATGVDYRFKNNKIFIEYQYRIDPNRSRNTFFIGYSYFFKRENQSDE